MMYGLGTYRIAGCLGFGGVDRVGILPWVHLGVGLLLLVGLVVLAVLLFKKLNRNGNANAVAALDLRFANGEMDEEEYQQKKKLLR